MTSDANGDLWIAVYGGSAVSIDYFLEMLFDKYHELICYTLGS